MSENIFDPIVESIFQCGKVIYKCLSGNKFDFREFFEAAGLKNKEGQYHNEDIQLVIIRTLNPAWVNNTPLFSINDSSLFDEIINIELDKEVFTELYLREIESQIHKFEEKIKWRPRSATG